MKVINAHLPCCPTRREMRYIRQLRRLAKRAGWYYEEKTGADRINYMNEMARRIEFEAFAPLIELLSDEEAK